MKQNGFNETIAVLASLFVFVSLASATPTILWEDFDDGNGNGAFDPAFIHTFGVHPEFGTGYLDWNLEDEYSSNPFLSVFPNTEDHITFILESNRYVSNASVLYATRSPTASISFVGQHGHQEFNDLVNWFIDPFWTLLEVDMGTLGPIQGIIVSGVELDDIRITVVPEPATWLLFLVGMVAILSIRNDQVLKSTNTTE